MTTQEIINGIKSGANENLKVFLLSVIEDKSDSDELFKTLWSEYKGDVPIIYRERPEMIPDYKALNKLQVGLRALFVLQGVTFTVGKESKVVINNSADTSKKDFDIVNDFRNRNRMHAKDIELLTYAGACGRAGRLVWIDENGEFRVTNILPYEYMLVGNNVTNEPEFGLIYHDIIEKVYGQKKPLTHKYIEIYDSETVQKVIIRENPEGGSYLEVVEEKKPHGFDFIPIVEFVNKRGKGDFQDERELINAYEKLLSIEEDELEDLRTTYMVFRGAEPDAETMEKAKFTGAFGSEDPEFDVRYLEKQANAERIKLQLERLRRDAFSSASRIDFRDDTRNAQSGYARALELQTLEDDCSLKRIELQRINSEMLKIINTGLSRISSGVDWLNIEIKYSSNLPIDLNYYGDFASKMFGKIPLIDLYRQLPFIKDPEQAVKDYESEQSGFNQVESVYGRPKAT